VLQFAGWLTPQRHCPGSGGCPRGAGCHGSNANTQCSSDRAPVAEGLWGGAQAGEKQVGGLKQSAVSGAGSGHLHNPAGANPALADVLRCLLCTQRPGDVPAMDDLLIRCHKRDHALSLELAGNLSVQDLLIGLDRQEKVGSLDLEELGTPEKANCDLLECGQRSGRTGRSKTRS